MKKSIWYEKRDLTPGSDTGWRLFLSSFLFLRFTNKKMKVLTYHFSDKFLSTYEALEKFQSIPEKDWKIFVIFLKML